MIDTKAVIEKAQNMEKLATKLENIKKYNTDIQDGKGVIKIGYGKESVCLSSVLGPEILGVVKETIKEQCGLRVKKLEEELKKIDTPSPSKAPKAKT